MGNAACISLLVVVKLGREPCLFRMIQEFQKELSIRAIPKFCMPLHINAEDMNGRISEEDLNLRCISLPTVE